MNVSNTILQESLLQPTNTSPAVLESTPMEKESVRMNRSKKTIGVWFWVLAVLLTLFSAAYQRLTGPTHDYRASANLGGTVYHAKLPRSADTTGEAVISLKLPGTITGVVFFRRHATSDPLKAMIMAREGERLVGYLPSQPPAGKLEYFLSLRDGPNEVRVPPNGQVVVRFRGSVPAWVLIAHVLLMFISMLCAARAGMELFCDTGLARQLTYWTVATLFLGGFVFGPIMQHYSFGDWWTGVPIGWDLTDNKTLIALIVWLVALAMLLFRRNIVSRRTRWTVFIAAFIMLAVFMIPHSLYGSELDYSKLESGASVTDAIGQG
jgi:hypothetical protein